MNFKSPQKNYLLIYIYVLPLSFVITSIADLICRNFQDNLFSGFWIKLLISVLSFLIIVISYKVHDKSQIKFGANGLKIPEWENNILAWEKIIFSVEDKKLLKIFPVLRLNIEYMGKKTYIEYDSSEIKNFCKLINLYCPKNLELYQLVQEYAKKPSV